MGAWASAKLELSALHAVFRSLSRSEIAEFREQWQATAIDRDEVLEIHDGSGERIVVCVTGYACQERFPTGRGRPRCLRVLSHGSVAGLALLADQSGLGRLEVVLALTPASLLVTTPETVKSFSRDHPHTYVDLVEALARELAMQQVRLERGTSQPIVSNLAFLLLMLSASFGESERPDVVPKALAARRWLAMFLGASNESVQRAVRTLRAEGLISTADNELRILNRPLLQQRANVDTSTLVLLARGQALRGRAVSSRAHPGARRRIA